MRKAMILGVVTLAATLASPAFADEFTGFRLGLQMSSDKLDGFYSHSVVAPSPTTSKNDSQRFGYALFGGWALNKWVAVEGGLHLGTKFNKSLFPAFVDTLDTTSGVGATKGDEFYEMEQDVKSFQGSVVGSWWITNKFSLFGRAGFMGWQSKLSYAYGDKNPASKVADHARDTGFAPIFGVGIQTQLDHALLRAEYQQADVGDLVFGSNFSSTDNTYSSLAFSVVWTL